TKYSYTLINKTYTPSVEEIAIINDINIDISYWGKKSKIYVDYKKNLKLAHYFGQVRRCAYCRTKLRTDAYWEDLDHIVAQSVREKWVFIPKNLIVTCEPCNRLKNASSTLADQMTNLFPNASNGFNIFNPHFDNWNEHFEIFKGIFLRGIPGTKGPNTFEFCRLYRYDVIINNVEEQIIWGASTMKRLTHRLKNVEKDSREFEQISKAISHMIQRKKNNQ
ncbi:hypothetical protein DNC80_14400, partial [Flavobacterium sp. SOK18b]|uniref:HNH endonuclease n=1 Tax=Flavobacterium sp. SOK18b TaxID=797900 RepID=UPI0015F83449